MRSTILAVACALTLVGGGAGSPPAEVEASDAAPAASDLQAYAALYGVTLKKAAIQWALEGGVPAIEAAAKSSLGPAFAGVWIDHRPDFLVVVAGVGDRAGDIAAIVANTPYAAMTRYVQTERSLDELGDIAEAAAAQARPPFDLEIDVKTNAVIVTFARVDAALAAAPGRSGLVIRIAERLSQPSAEIYAGLTLGGGCTAGFSVKDANDRKGMMTAGHCPNAQAFGGVNLPYQDGHAVGSADAQWHTTPGLTDAGKIKLGGSTYRIVTGKLNYSAISTGATLCKFGSATGYGCGELTTKTYKPNWVVFSTPYFGRITNCSVDMSTPGDSGGPVFRNGDAVGIISGYYSDVFCANDQNIFSFFEFDADLVGVSVIKG